MKNIGDLINTFYEQNILAYIQSLQEYPIKFVSLILDITIVVFLAYELIKIVKGSRAWQLIKGIAFLVVATGISKLLNLYILNSFPYLPTLFCKNNILPFESNFIAILTNINIGNKIIIPTKDIIKSKILFVI